MEVGEERCNHGCEHEQGGVYVEEHCARYCLCNVRQGMATDM